MGNFNRGRNSGGFGGGNRFGGRNSSRDFGGNRATEMFTATCDNCGNRCEVPFKPTGEKPVYCSDCFRNMKGDDNGGNFNRRDNRSEFRGNRSFDKQMFSAVCDNCGNRCEVPFKPSGDKPIYCSNCFEKNNDRSDRGANRNGGPKPAAGNDKLLEQITALNAKMDRLMDALMPKTTVKLKINGTPLEQLMAEANDKPQETQIEAVKTEKPKKAVKPKQTAKKAVAKAEKPVKKAVKKKVAKKKE